MRTGEARRIAFGGMMAALAVVIMCLGGLIPVATFTVPVICMLILAYVLKLCGKRIGWAWYGAVSILGLLLGPDKEAAAIFLFLGYYPILKPRLDRMKLGIVLKALIFNSMILLMYGILIYLMGMQYIAQEYHQLGKIMTIFMLVGGNAVFFLLDKALRRFNKIK